MKVNASVLLQIPLFFVTVSGRKIQSSAQASGLQVSGCDRGNCGDGSITDFVKVSSNIAPLTSLLYGVISDWSPCSEFCTTQRSRICQYEQICKQRIITEESLCFQPGSKCEGTVQSLLGSLKENFEHKTLEHIPVKAVGVEQGGFEKGVHEDKLARKALKKRRKNKNSIFPENCGIRKEFEARRWSKIVGGQETSPRDWPWIVALLSRYGTFQCGATLISPKWVLTAAHCNDNNDIHSVRFAEHDLETKEDVEVQMEIEKLFTHPKYNPSTYDNDIALIKLPKAVMQHRKIHAACLPAPGELLPYQKNCIIMGWGTRASSHFSGSDELLYAKVPIATKKTCKAGYPLDEITHNMFCAGFKRGGTDTCSGDSGGPLQCHDDNEGRWIVYGITSWGNGCGKENILGVYTKVVNYLDWVKRTIKHN